MASLIVLAVIWGGSIPLTKLGLRDFPPLTLTALRYLVAAPVFLVVLLRHPLPPARGLAAAGALGVLGIGVGQVSQTLGVLRTTASAATVISATIPILVVAFAAIRLSQPIRIRQACGLAVAFGGIGCVVIGNPDQHAPAFAAASLVGDALVLLSAVAVALYYVLSTELAGRYSVTAVAALTSLAGAGAVTPIAAWEASRAQVSVTVQGVAVVLYLAILVTAFGIWVWLRALRRLPASTAAALQYLQPLVGVAASAALFGDRLGVWFWAGTALVLAGVALTTASPHEDRSRAAQNTC
jgi:drug/metabolite transporter (DMT)-like permease